MNDLVEAGDQTPAPSFELVDVESAKAFMDNYQAVCKSLLSKSDYQEIIIGGKKMMFKKKSAWRKIATAFNISDEVVEKDIIRDENYQIISATFMVKVTAPNGRTGIATASCSIFDKINYKDTSQPSNFELRKRFNNAENDVIATAHTRAKSRAISDLVGMGETSAEEMEGIADKPKKSVKAKKVVKSAKPRREVLKDKLKEKAKIAAEKAAEKPPLDDEAIEVEVMTPDKPAKSLKDMMEEDKNIKRAINELQEENRIVNRSALADRLLTMLQSGAISEEDYKKAKAVMD